MGTEKNLGKHKFELPHMINGSREIVDCYSIWCPGNPLYKGDPPGLRNEEPTPEIATHTHDGHVFACVECGITRATAGLHSDIEWDTAYAADQQARTMITLLNEQLRVTKSRIDDLNGRLRHIEFLRQSLQDNFDKHRRRANH